MRRDALVIVQHFKTLKQIAFCLIFTIDYGKARCYNDNKLITLKRYDEE